MSINDKIRETGISVIKDEFKAIERLVDSINQDFITAANLIFSSKGRVIITGIGKSAIIAQKIVATLNSTGTPSIFMHAADAIHGDLGIVRPDDVVMTISKSGETPEVKVLIPLLKGRKNKIIALVGNVDSYLAHQADVVLDSTVDKEACPNNLAPTTSTTAQLVLGDALAVSLLKMRGFTAKDFAEYHPGGALGKRMYMRVFDLSSKNEAPQVDIDENVSNVIIEISSKRLGATAVMDNGRLAGIVTDGDLRRMIEKHLEYKDLVARDIMSANPRTIEKDELMVVALSIMRENNITQLMVMDKGSYCGVVHLHDILKEGVF